MQAEERYNIAPTPVTYSGYNFRSWLEGKWAMVFDKLEVSWEYEAQNFNLGSDLGWYVPDFWLPEHQMFIEVKGPLPTEKELVKLRALWESKRGFTCAMLGNIPAARATVGFCFPLSS